MQITVRRTLIRWLQIQVMMTRLSWAFKKIIWCGFFHHKRYGVWTDVISNSFNSEKKGWMSISDEDIRIQVEKKPFK